MTDIRWHAIGMDDVPADDDWLDEYERARFSTMVYPKRLSESRLGRWTAKATIARAFGMDQTRVEMARIAVRNAPDGAPELTIDGASVDAVIAMTDRSDWAVCAIRRGRERIGCDLEVVEPRSPAFVDDYFTPAEREVVAHGDHDLLANLIWSAKESALKVLRTGLRRDTRTVEVTLGDARDGGWQAFTVEDAEGDPQWGWWIRHGAFVLTVACAVPTDVPVALVHPSPLASAVPTHRWMERL
mgnify:CR=1 FL=1